MHLEVHPFIIDSVCKTDLAPAEMEGIVEPLDQGKSMGSIKVALAKDIFGRVEAVPLVKSICWEFGLFQKCSLNLIVGQDCIWRPDQRNSEEVVAVVHCKGFSCRRLVVVCSHHCLPSDLASNIAGFEQGDEHHFGGDQVGKDSDMSIRLPYLWLNSI